MLEFYEMISQIGAGDQLDFIYLILKKMGLKSLIIKLVMIYGANSNLDFVANAGQKSSLPYNSQ